MITDKTMDRIAETIFVAADNDEKELNDKLQKLSDLSGEFAELNSEMISAIKELEEKKAAIEKKLKSNFKEWEMTCNYNTLRAQLLKQALEMSKAGKKVGAVVEGIKLEIKRSQKPSYATGFNVALTLLNEVTQNKYLNLPELCKKDIAALETGIDVLDKDLGEFGDEIRELADKRGIKISSISFKADMVSFLKEIGTRIKGWFSRSISALKNLFTESKSTTSKIEEFNKALSKY